MAKQFSTALQNYIATRGSINDGLNNGVLVLFSGTQPATADAGYATNSGSPLVAITENSGVVTKQVDPYFSIEFTAGTTDPLTSITFAGIEILGSSVSAASTALFATALISSINNNNRSPIKCFAKAGTGNIVKVYLPKNTGASVNTNDTVVLTRTGSSLTASVNNVSAPFDEVGNTQATVSDVIAAGSYSALGVDGINILNLITSTTGTTGKETPMWSGVAGTDNMNTALGTAGFTGFTSGTAITAWFRYYSSLDDPELTGVSTTDANGTYIRYDGSIGTTSAYDMVAAGGTTLTYNAIHTVPTFTFTVPANQA